MSSLLTIAVPSTLNDANIESLSVPENDKPLWSSTSTYALGVEVMVLGADIHQIWKSVIADNINHNPLSETDLNNPVYWSFVGVTNAYKMFDQFVSSQTESAGSITFTLKNLGQVNTLAFFGIVGDSVTLEIQEADGTPVSTASRDLVSYSTFNGFYDWFFTPFLPLDFTVFEGLPPIFNARYKITVLGPVCKIGAVVPAYGYTFNAVNRGSNINPKDYSLKQELTPGVFQFQKGPSVLENELEFFFDPSKLDLLNRLIKQRFSLPTLVIGNSDYESFTSYGNINACPNSLPYASDGFARLKIESLF